MVMNRLTAGVAVLTLALAAPGYAQQKPATAADKAAAEKAMDDAAKKAAEMAEAMARAQQKVVEEARQKDLAAAREQIEKGNAIVPVDLEVVVSRYLNDKRMSALPYALTVNTKYVPMVEQAPTTSLRMGGEVPLSTMSPFVGQDGKAAPIAGPVQYKFVGTNIDAQGRILEGGRFELLLSVQDDARAPPQNGGPAALPVIRSFRASNTVVLRDGQTRQFIAAADRITGEVVKVDVTLKIAK